MRALTTAKVELAGPPESANGSITVAHRPPWWRAHRPRSVGSSATAVAAERVAVQDGADEVGERPERGHRPPVDVERGGGLATSG